MASPSDKEALRVEVLLALKSDKKLFDTIVEEVTKSKNIGKHRGTDLLGKLKHEIDIEKIVIHRLWEIMSEEWFLSLVQSANSDRPS